MMVWFENKVLEFSLKLEFLKFGKPGSVCMVLSDEWSQLRNHLVRGSKITHLGAFLYLRLRRGGLISIWRSAILFSMQKRTQIIAEVKTKSPFGFSSDKSWDDLFRVANEIGDIISIHTDARWGGSFDLIKKAKSLTDKPILAKGIHADDALVEKAFESGADWVLVVGRIPRVNPAKCFIEPLTLDELKRIPVDLRVVWNSRDIATGGLKRETFAQARKIFGGWLCQASNIKTVDDVEEGADAVLVGTHLVEFARSIERL